MEKEGNFAKLRKMAHFFIAIESFKAKVFRSKHSTSKFNGQTRATDNRRMAEIMVKLMLSVMYSETH